MQFSRTLKRPKASTHITLTSARNLYHACRYALPSGGEQSRWGCPPANVSAPVPLNYVVTIQWNKTKTGEDNFQALRNQRFCRWLRTRSKQLGKDFKPYYTFSREKNHVHWSVYIPDELIDEFRDLLPRWITSLEAKGEGPRKRAENHQPAPEGTVVVERNRNSVTARNYQLKGIEPEQAFRLGIKEPSDEGVVFGKRAGVSRTLGWAARERAGYRAKPPFWARNNGKVVYNKRSDAKKDRKRSNSHRRGTAGNQPAFGSTPTKSSQSISP